MSGLAASAFPVPPAGTGVYADRILGYITDDAGREQGVGRRGLQLGSATSSTAWFSPLARMRLARAGHLSDGTRPRLDALA